MPPTSPDDSRDSLDPITQDYHLSASLLQSKLRVFRDIAFIKHPRSDDAAGGLTSSASAEFLHQCREDLVVRTSRAIHPSTPPSARASRRSVAWEQGVLVVSRGNVPHDLRAWVGLHHCGKGLLEVGGEEE